MLPALEEILASRDLRRRELMQTVWQWASDITPEIYLEHLARRSFPACCSDVYREFPVLELYDRAFERIVSELKENIKKSF